MAGVARAALAVRLIDYSQFAGVANQGSRRDVTVKLMVLVSIMSVLHKHRVEVVGHAMLASCWHRVEVVGHS